MPKPKPSRPDMPGYGIVDAKSGRGLLPWRWASDRVFQGRTYWVATSRPDARPHVMPVWGVWFDDTFFFSTGNQSQKARNLALNPRCSIAVEIDFPRRSKRKDRIKDAVIIEGLAELTRDPRLRKKFCQAYQQKYAWDMENFSEPIYRVKPSKVFGFTDGFNQTATRWKFD